jgi:hypothetical protein
MLGVEVTHLVDDTRVVLLRVVGDLLHPIRRELRRVPGSPIPEPQVLLQQSF